MGTIDVNEPRAMSDETVRSGQEIVHANAETDLLNYLVELVIDYTEILHQSGRQVMLPC